MNRLSQLAISEEGFIFDPTTGESFTVNKIGIDIISALRQNKNEDEIVKSLEKKYDMEANIVERDVSDFISHLRTYKLFK